MDGKLWRENRKENFFVVCLVGWRERKINGGTHVFFFRPTKKFSLQNEEKTKGKNCASFFNENAHVQLHIDLSKLLFFTLFLFFLLLDVACFFFFLPLAERCFFYFLFYLFIYLLLLLFFFTRQACPCPVLIFFCFLFVFSSTFYFFTRQACPVLIFFSFLFFLLSFAFIFLFWFSCDFFFNFNWISFFNKGI